MERLSVSTEGTLAPKSVAPSVYKLASGGSVHTAEATQETKRSNPSDEAWGEVTAEVPVYGGWRDCIYCFLSASHVAYNIY